MRKYCIIVAGGSGQRMGSDTPKQFLKVHSEVILQKSISAFYRYDSNIKIIIALPEEHISTWEKICLEENFTIPHLVVNGGKTRYHSVKNALGKITEQGLVAIHDGVRPLVSKETIENTFNIASQKGNAIPYTDMVDSIRFIDNTNNRPVDRTQYKLVQTPQVFDIQLIQKAYQQEWENSFTDDASVIEKLGVKINLVPGNKENIKITTKTDLIIAQALSDYLSA